MLSPWQNFNEMVTIPAKWSFISHSMPRMKHFPVWPGIIIFSIGSYYRDLSCSKSITKSFVSYPVNEIQAYKYNILMTLQSAIASTVRVIAGILVCIVLRLPTGLPPALQSCVLYFCIYEYFEKLTKLVT